MVWGGGGVVEGVKFFLSFLYNWYFVLGYVAILYFSSILFTSTASNVHHSGCSKNLIICHILKGQWHENVLIDT
jgi:hypothetical protein